MEMGRMVLLAGGVGRLRGVARGCLLSSCLTGSLHNGGAVEAATMVPLASVSHKDSLARIMPKESLAHTVPMFESDTPYGGVIRC